MVCCSYLEYNAVTPSSSYAPFCSLVLYQFLQMISIRTGNSMKQFFPTRLNSIPNHLDLTSSRRYLHMWKKDLFLDDKGRKRFFPTDSIRSESVWNDFSEKVFVKIKMIHISILSYSLNSVRKRLKRFLEKVIVKITQFIVWPLSVSIDYTLLLGARRSCGQF